MPKNKNDCIDWKKCIGHSVRFICDEIIGYLKIVDYMCDWKHTYILIEFNDKRKWFRTCRLRENKISNFVKYGIIDEQKPIFSKRSASKIIMKSYIKGAEERGLNFSLSEDDFLKMIQLPCFYCGSTYSNTYKSGKHTFSYNGLDRIDNNKGYELDNIVPCCKHCNIAKHTMSQKDYFLLIEKTYKNLCKNKYIEN